MREISDKKRMQGGGEGGYEGQEVAEQMMQAVVHDTPRQWGCRAFGPTFIEGQQTRFYKCTSDSSSITMNAI